MNEEGKETGQISHAIEGDITGEIAAADEILARKQEEEENTRYSNLLDQDTIVDAPLETSPTKINKKISDSKEVMIDFNKIPGKDRKLFSEQLKSGALSKEDFLIMYPEYTSPKPKKN